MGSSVWYLSVRKKKIIFAEYPSSKSKPSSKKSKKRLKKNG